MSDTNANDTEGRTLKQKKMYEGDSVPADAEIVHTEAKGGTGPLLVWYFETDT